MTMKTFLTSLLLGLSAAALAQSSRHATTHTSINDDDQTLSIQVEGHVNGKEVSYNRRFNVTGLSSAQKDALKNSVFDSLGLGEAPKPPKPPKPPVAPAAEPADEATGEVAVTFTCKTCAGQMRLEVTGENFTLTRDVNAKGEDRRTFPMMVSMRPGAYRYQYWQNGVLQMQLPFTVKAGEASVVNVK